MSTSDQASWWFVPRTTIGRILLGIYIISLGAVSLPLYDIAFNSPELLGPLPETATWTYIWFGVMNLVLLGTYYWLFRPWAEQATQYLDEWDDQAASPTVEDTPSATTQSTDRSDD